VTLDSAVVAYIYLDAREGERPGAAEAVGFCQAISRFTGLALANIKRADLQNRQMRLEEDLRGARQAQAFLCPSGQGSIGPLRYAVETRPGRVVAGDLFDVFPIGSGRVGLCFGDVSGQGMAAGIHMTAVLASLRTALLAGPDPADATAFVNRYMTERSPEHVFVSLWVGVYDLEDGTLRYVDAGHGHWLVKRRGEQAAPAGRPGGLIVGVDAEHRYGALTLRLEPGDRVILYSDGVSERASPGGELFGTERVIAALEGSASPQEDVARLFAAGQEFAGGAAIADDTTAASVERSDA
jgi:serine phosphatase RsbU (regulator of sigma subunit)